MAHVRQSIRDNVVFPIFYRGFIKIELSIAASSAASRVVARPAEASIRELIHALNCGPAVKPRASHWLLKYAAFSAKDVRWCHRLLSALGVQPTTSEEAVKLIRTVIDVFDIKLRIVGSPYSRLRDSKP